MASPRPAGRADRPRPAQRRVLAPRDGKRLGVRPSQKRGLVNLQFVYPIIFHQCS